MKLDQYQTEARTFAAFPPDSALVYTGLGLVNEAGEYAGKVKKMIRGDYILNPESREKLASELGDVLWYLAACADTLGYSLELVAENNLAKLADRKARGVISGDGDNR
jgi:NTP pyrophosphatase (non-canonical NTP hydrolase)